MTEQASLCLTYAIPVSMASRKQPCHHNGKMENGSQLGKKTVAAVLITMMNMMLTMVVIILPLKSAAS